MPCVENLDEYLFQTLHFLQKKWYDPEVGIVACCLKDGNKLVFATSARNGSNWLHAERNAYKKFKDLYGEPTMNAVFIVTLSPCVASLKYRAEPSCVDLIKSLGIKQVHFGVLDTMHAPLLQDYIKLGLKATLSENPKLKEMCKKLMDMFKTYDSRINSELLSIKQELGDTFFSPLKDVHDEKTHIGSLKCKL